jgi:hypothetical protein
LTGYVTASQLNAVEAEITNLSTGVTKSTNLRASLATLDSLAIPSSLSVFGSSIRFHQVVATNGTFNLLGS